MEDSVPLTTMAVEFLTDGSGDRRDEIAGKDRSDWLIHQVYRVEHETHRDVLEQHAGMCVYVCVHCVSVNVHTYVCR